MSADVIIYAMLAGILPSFIWLYFWVKEDRHTEPKTMIAATFLSGILIVFLAIVIERYFSTIFVSESLKFLSWAATEEILKYLAVAVVALGTDYNDEPIDSMIYMIAVALGFAAFENALFILDPFTSNNLLVGMMTGNMRFMGSTLVHVVSSATVGFALGLVFYRGYLAKAVALFFGLAAAIFFHTAFNLSIINADSGGALKVFAWVWGAVVILIILFEEIKVVKPKNEDIHNCLPAVKNI